jgi:hypothetical protein
MEMASYITIASGQTQTLTSSPPSGTDIKFLNDSGNSGGLIIQNNAFNVVTSTVNGTLSTSAYIDAGGRILNFQPGYMGIPGDQITIVHVATLFSALDVFPSASSYNDDFTNKATNGAGLQQFLINPDGSIEYLVKDPYTFTSAEVQIIDEIEQSLFGTAALADGVTIELAFTTQLNPNGNGVFADAVFSAWNAAINPCFAAGTRILTPRGEVPVENLQPGDLVITREGEEQPVIWVGQREVNITAQLRPEAVRPIIIEADALADGVPARNLIVSPDHALYLDGMLVPAKDLVNWTTIRQDHEAARVTYFHIELPRHGVIFAEGAAVETFLDTGHRGVFDNAEIPVIALPAAMQERREAESCAPLCTSGPALEAIRQRIAARQVGIRLSGTSELNRALRRGQQGSIRQNQMPLTRCRRLMVADGNNGRFWQSLAQRLLRLGG